MKRSPWFNAMKQPPVNGGDDALYEHRCLSDIHTRWRVPHKTDASWINWWACDRCQWRGLLRREKTK